jgi:UDP-glucuronate 4-epimerase
MAEKMRQILVTGCAGFIGFHLARRLLQEGSRVVGVDNLSDYYDVGLKLARLEQLQGHSEFRFLKLDLADRAGVADLFRKHRFDRVVNLAAQAGVRYSLENPDSYVDANLVGFANILEGCRHQKVEHLVYASSSSVYGANTRQPFSVHAIADHPVSLYGATKRANELMAHTYAHLFALPCTGLRFFTVYGPWGRPDMAPFLFTKAILEERPINVFNQGAMSRDFTYVDDVIETLQRVIEKIPQPDPDWSGANPDPSTSKASYRIYNLGNSRPVELMAFIRILESVLGKKARMNLLPLQPGDVPGTYADIEDLAHDIGFRPDTPIEVGVRKFVEWYREYYRV